MRPGQNLSGLERLLANIPLFHDQYHAVTVVFKQPQILERIAVDHNQVGQFARRERALVGLLEVVSAVARGYRGPDVEEGLARKQQRRNEQWKKQ